MASKTGVCRSAYSGQRGLFPRLLGQQPVGGAEVLDADVGGVLLQEGVGAQGFIWLHQAEAFQQAARGGAGRLLATAEQQAQKEQKGEETKLLLMGAHGLLASVFLGRWGRWNSYSIQRRKEKCKELAQNVKPCRECRRI